jgi:hypothetical protein
MGAPYIYDISRLSVKLFLVSIYNLIVINSAIFCLVCGTILCFLF